MGALTGHPVRNIFRQLLLGSLGAKSSQPAWFSPRCHLQWSRKQLRLGSPWLGSAWSGLVHTPSRLPPCCGYREGETEGVTCVCHPAHLLQHDSRQLPFLPRSLALSLCLAQGCHFLLARAGFSYFPPLPNSAPSAFAPRVLMVGVVGGGGIQMS